MKNKYRFQFIMYSRHLVNALSSFVYLQNWFPCSISCPWRNPAMMSLLFIYCLTFFFLFILSFFSHSYSQTQETMSLVSTVLDMQPRLSSGSGAQSNDEIVYDLASDILKQLMDKLDMDEAKPEMFDVCMTLFSVFFQIGNKDAFTLKISPSSDLSSWSLVEDQ